MKAIRIGLALTLAVALTATWTWADGTDFSGTWKLNAEKSDQPGGGRGGGGGGRGGGRGGGTPPEMTITQSEDAITVSAGQRELVYKPGAGPQEITGGRMGGTQETRWDGAKLVIDRTISSQRGEFKIKTTWSLSEDGKTLTQEISRDTPQGSRTAKVVYDKQ